MTWAILNKDIQAGVYEFSESKSDRVSAIMGGAVVEEALLQALSLRLRESSVQELMFNPGRPLGDFFAKINLGYLLLMYETDTHSALIGIAEIRNAFAHQLTISSFDSDTKKIIDAFSRLKLHSKYKKYPAPFWGGDSDYLVEECKSKQDIFRINIKILLFLLMRDHYVHIPHSNVGVPLPKGVENRLRVPPTSHEKSS